MPEAISALQVKLPSAPATPQQATTKDYVDVAVIGKVSRTGDTMLGALYLDDAIVISGANQVVGKGYVDSAVVGGGMPASTVTCTPTGNVAATDIQAAIVELDNKKLALSGGSMSGTLTLAADPAASLQAVTKQYADHVPWLDSALDGDVTNPESVQSPYSSARNKLLIRSNRITNTHINSAAAIAFSKMAALSTNKLLASDGSGIISVLTNFTIDGSGNIVAANNKTITGLPTPVNASDATNKSYVDNLAFGLRDFKESVRVTTKANIADLASVDMSSTTIWDLPNSITFSVGNRLLVRSQTNAVQNGLYKIDTLNGNTAALIRTTDADGQTGGSSEISGGMFVYVEEGSTQFEKTAWIVSSTGDREIGVDTIEFVQYSGATAATAGLGLYASGNVFNVGTASVARIVVNTDNIDLADYTAFGGVIGATNKTKFSFDNYGRITAVGEIITSNGLVRRTGTDTFTTNTGTNNYLPKWSSDALTGTSLVFDSGTNVGINTNSPLDRLTVYEAAARCDMRLQRGGNGVTNDQIGSYRFIAGNASGTATTYSQIISYIVSPSDSTEIGAINFEVLSSGFTNIPLSIRSNKVGIKATDPQAPLEVTQSSNNGIFIRNTTESVNNLAAIHFLTGTGNQADANLLGSIRSVITQANPSTLKSDIFITVNIGDSEQEVLRCTSNRYVGINITNPGRTLSVYQAASPVIQLINSSTGSTANDGLLITQAGAHSYIENAENGNLYFRTNATDRVLIDQAGHVLPALDNTYDLGSATFSWRNIYADGSMVINGTTVGTIYRETYIVGNGGLAAGTPITIPNSRSYEFGTNKLQVFVNGILQEKDTNSGANDNDYWEASSTSVDFTYALRQNSKVTFIIFTV